MTRGRPFGVLCAIGLALVASVVAASPASAAVTATITPSTDLADGQTVTITADGFNPDASVGVAQCAAAVGTSHSTADCDLSLSRTGNADGSGHASFTLRVKATINTSSGAVDCVTAPDHCVVGIGDLNDLSRSAGSPITFDPDAPPVGPPTVAVTPHVDLVDRQEVTVKASGFLPDEWVSVSQCPTEESECYGYPGAGEPANDAGRISTTIAVRRVLASFDEVYDCATPGVCQIVVQVPGLPSGTAPITFDASQPLPDPPTITVTPSDGLADHQIVTIAGSGFSPSASVQLQECVDTDAPYPSCSGAAYRNAVADAAGNITTTMQTRRTIRVYEEDGSESDVDCAVSVVPCTIVAINYDEPFETARVPIAFDPDRPLPQGPTMTATPTSGLIEGTVVTVTADGFAPGSSIYIVQCSAAAVDADGCDLNRLGGVPADDAGHVTGTYTVARVIHVGGGSTSLDCASSPGACVIAVAFVSDTIEAAKTPLTFDPNGPGGPGGDDPVTSGPTATADGNDPPAVDGAETNDPDDDSATDDPSSSTELARTGADSTYLIAVALGLVAVGIVVVQVGAIRRRTCTQGLHVGE